MKLLAIRSIPLSEETREGWHAAGVKFAKRRRSDAEIQRIIDRYDYDAAINLGDRGFKSETTPIWNDIETVLSVMSTVELRKTLDGEGMPARRTDVPHWVKPPGLWGGMGVKYHEPHDHCDRTYYEVQEHIEGDEYRVITVGDKIVQASRKVNCEWINDRHHFDYEWCGVEGISRNGLIPLVKSAVESIPHGAHSVLGWDCIVADRPYIIECNTSPGVNEPTAHRIVRAMEAASEETQMLAV